ncbi:hypothetical protein M3924_002989 [Vibrio fluvialis]|nr:hypothetical protein [Vibrio fluvialis]
MNKIGKVDIFWGYVSQVFGVGYGLILIPVILKFLTPEEVGVWYLFSTFLMAAQLLEFGLKPTISRQLSYIYAGANRIISEGLPEFHDTKKISYQLLFDFIDIVRMVYKIISFFVVVLIGCLGSIYLYHLNIDSTCSHIWGAWGIFVISITLNFYFSYFDGVLIGRGLQRSVNKAITVSRIVMVMSSSILLVFGLGIISLSIGLLLSTLSYRVIVAYYFTSSTDSELNSIKSTSGNRMLLLKVMWLSSWKLGATNLGSFCVKRSSYFVVASYFGLDLAGKLGVTLQIINLISSVGSMIFNLNLPRMNFLQSDFSKNYKEIRKIFFSSLVFSHLVYILSGVFLYFWGPWLLSIVSPNADIIHGQPLVLLLIVYYLEINHTIFATYLTSLNKVPFFKASIISGFLIVVLNYLVCKYTDMNIVGIIIVQLLVQLAYNNWKWPVEALNQLKKVN